MAFLSIPVHNCCRPFSRTLRSSDIIDEMLGMAFQPLGYPRHLCLLQNNSSKQPCYQDNDHIKVAELDVKKYKPDEVDCKVENGKVLVSGKQRKETEHGYETSEFHRAYDIPENVDPQSVKSRIENGILRIEGVKQQPEEGEDNKKLSLEINLANYKPEEVNVKLQGNGLIVSAENKTEKDGVYTCRSFKKYFTLPNEVDGSTLVSKLNQDGVLKIEAERKPMEAIEDIKVQRDEEIENMTDDTEPNEE